MDAVRRQKRGRERCMFVECESGGSGMWVWVDGVKTGERGGDGRGREINKKRKKNDSLSK